MYMHNNHCHRLTAHLQSNILDYIIYYIILMSFIKANVFHKLIIGSEC